MKPIVILSKDGKCLYGHKRLESIIRTQEAEECLVVRKVEAELFLVYLQKFFSNHRAVQVLHAAPAITLKMLEAVSSELTLTEQDVANLMAIDRGINGA